MDDGKKRGPLMTDKVSQCSRGHDMLEEDYMYTCMQHITLQCRVFFIGTKL